MSLATLLGESAAMSAGGVLGEVLGSALASVTGTGAENEEAPAGGTEDQLIDSLPDMYAAMRLVGATAVATLVLDYMMDVGGPRKAWKRALKAIGA